MVNWVAVILLMIALVLLFIFAIIISTSIRQSPGSGSSYGLNGFGSMVGYGGYAGTVTVDSGKLVSVAVLNWIAFVALVLGLIAVSAKDTVNRGLTSVIRTRS